ncbi:nucleotidyltransferase domain-containing protein [Bifidobacterium sp. SO1]|uniref:DNA polymerase beta superfamily protein n=1 Tax=Bifidobacterium sp. SO1 TaxID=2809029 RepID=UPI001BDC22CB|nr:nucleotidyltransferase domain-containing protein [Bifidobacterium sp. SO1]MBT1162124.1 nucleotidyltransferase domain-containing protein [Bifidobacterium sp. SO1]
MSIDIESYRRQLEPFADLGVLSAWVAGSHMHGLADSQSDVDLKVIVAPTASDILLQKADWVRPLHSPDVTVMTPIPFMRQLVKGSPVTLETLTVSPTMILTDHGLLTALRAYAGLLTTSRTLDMALRNARANMHILDRRSDLSDRKRRKMVAETLRLFAGIDAIREGGAWPACLPFHESLLRGVRDGSIQIDRNGLDDLYGEAERTVERLGVIEYSNETREQVEALFADLMRRIVDSRQETTPITVLSGLLGDWAERNGIRRV